MKSSQFIPRFASRRSCSQSVYPDAVRRFGQPLLVLFSSHWSQNSSIDRDLCPAGTFLKSVHVLLERQAVGVMRGVSAGHTLDPKCGRRSCFSGRLFSLSSLLESRLQGTITEAINLWGQQCLVGSSEVRRALG